MKTFIIMLLVAFLSNAQTALFPVDSLIAGPSIMTSLPTPTVLSNVISKYSTFGFTAKYQFKGKTITANIFDCETEASSKRCFTLLFNYAYNDLIKKYQDTTIVVGYYDTSMAYKQMQKYIINITTDTSNISIANARLIELEIIKNISTLPVRFRKKNYKFDQTTSDNKCYLANGKAINNPIKTLAKVNVGLVISNYGSKTYLIFRK